MNAKLRIFKRVIALLLVCTLIFSNVNIFEVSASTVDTSGSSINWDNATELKTSGMYVMTSGDYILKSDLSASQPYIINTGVTVNLNLNGYTLTNICNMEDYAAFDGDVYTDSIIFINGGTLNLYDDSRKSYYWDADSETIKEGSSEDEGYNFTGGAITGGYNTKKLLGGAGVCVSSGTFNMYSGNIVGNTTDPAEDGILGAGVYVNTGATFNMYSGSFVGNTCSGNGGGLYNKGTVNIYDGTFSRNSADNCLNYGGGLYNAGTMYINGGTIEYNEALGGGGISNVGKMYMTGGSISNNYTTGSSGGVLIGWAATFEMSGGIISDNYTKGTAGGVGLKTYKGVFTMTGGVITGNKSGSFGGGVQVTNGDGFYIGGTASIIDNEMTNGTVSNVWLDTDYYMTQISELTNTIGVTKAGGTGLVSVSSSTYTITEEQTTQKYISDEVYYEVLDIDETGDNLQYSTSFSEVDDKVYLRVERVIDGIDQEKEYQAEPYDITTLGLFNLTGLGDATYTVESITGKGTFNANTNELTVSKVGTFLVEVETAYNITEVPTTGTAILTITPKGVTITDLEAIERGPIEDNVYVDLDTSKGTITGIESGDSVSIYYGDALATIDNVNYDDSNILNTEGKEVFDVSVDHLYLTGDDSENYYIIEIEKTTVTINMSIPYIAWPTATDLVYGDTQSNDQLIGGKVIVKVMGGDYVEITENGSFEWVTTNTSTQNVETYSYSVHFVEDDSKIIDDTTYHTTLESMTQDVSYLVNAAPVIFTVTDSIVQYDGNAQFPTVVAYYGDELISSNLYTIVYTQYDEKTKSYVEVANPTEVGTYFVSATFKTDNYRHAGTTVSTGKQIAAFTIYETDTTVETYSVTFKEPDGTEYTDLKIEGAQYQDIHVLPSVDIDKYYAWETTLTKSVYEFDTRMTQQAYDMTLTAVPNPTTYTVSGTITGTDLDGTANDTLDDIAVVLMQGNNLIASTVTDDDGYYEFNVEAGLYTIVVTRDQGVRNEISTFLEVDGNEVRDFVLPDIRQNTILNVAAGLPDITVENMDSFFTDDEENTFTIDITGIDIEDKEEDEYNEIMKVAIEDGFTYDNLKEFFEISYTERPESEHTEFTHTDELLVYHIPLSGIYQGYEYYTIYRYNDGDIETITTVPNANGEYMELASDGQSILLYIKQADIYGIAFTENEVTVEAGKDVTKVYQEDAFDLTKLGMFDNLNITRTDGTYTVEAITGEGSFDGGTSLDVTSIGTFEVTLTFPETDSEHREIYTATLTVTAKEVTIIDLIAISQKPVTGDTSVELDIDEGTISGLVNNDSVTIDFTDYKANITTEDYTDIDYYKDSDDEITGSKDFDVAVTGLVITGEDAHNYILVEPSNTTVNIYFSIPDIAWPTATNLTYLDQELPELNGGKVVIQDQDGFYTDITDQGEFKWVTEDGTILETFNANFTGDTNLYVMFVEYDETASSGYHDILKTMIEPVTFIIETAPTQFVIENNSYTVDSEDTISITAYYDGAVVNSSEYTIYYRVDGTTDLSTTVPTDVGFYLVSAEFKNYGTTTGDDTSDDIYLYNHIGTQESTGKQIGSLYIYEQGGEPTTYTVTFLDENGDEFEDLKITNANYQDIHILPDLGDGYSGWETEEGVLYDFNARFPQQASNYVLTAVKVADDITISGTVTGTDLNYYSDVPISNISVMLYSGGEIIATTTTDTNGYYELSVPAGRYTIVFNRDQHGYENEESIFIDATDGEDVTCDIEFPDFEQIIDLVIDASLPAITVDGLDYFKNYFEASFTQMNIDDVSVSAEDGGVDETKNITDVAYGEGYSADTLKIFFDITITQTTYDESGNAITVSITDLSEFFASNSTGTGDAETGEDDGKVDAEDRMLTFYIPLSGIYQGKESYVVYREHINSDGGMEIQKITYDVNDDGEYIELIDGGQTIKMVVNKFSVFGIGFTESADIFIPTVGVELGQIAPFAVLGSSSLLFIAYKAKKKKYYKVKR